MTYEINEQGSNPCVDIVVSTRTDKNKVYIPSEDLSYKITSNLGGEFHREEKLNMNKCILVHERKEINDKINRMKKLVANGFKVYNI